MSELIALWQETKILLGKKEKEYEKKKLQIYQYIHSINDSYIRSIMTLRHIERLKWWQIAQRIGGDNKSDGLRKAHNRYLDKFGGQ